MKCPHGKRLKCWVTLDKTRAKHCPFNDKRFMEALEVWAYTDRTPKSVALDAEHLDGRGADGFDDFKLARKAEMFHNFDRGGDIWLVVVGLKCITFPLCKDMMRGRKKWLRKLDHHEFI